MVDVGSQEVTNAFVALKLMRQCTAQIMLVPWPSLLRRHDFRMHDCAQVFMTHGGRYQSSEDVCPSSRR